MQEFDCERRERERERGGAYVALSNLISHDMNDR